LGFSWFAFWWLLAAAALIVWRLAWQARWSAFAAWPLLFAAAFSGAAWHHAQWNLFDRFDSARYATFTFAPACVEAIARGTPQRVSAPDPTPLRAIPGGERSRLSVSILGIRDGTQWRPASGECQIFAEGHLLSIRPGDRLRVFGQFSRISPPRNPGEFDFAAHARADGELVRIRSSAPESVTIMDRAGPWRVDRIVDSLRDGAKRLVQTFVGPERADLACAILLGARQGLTSEEL
jgi:competence protein ComEC